MNNSPPTVSAVLPTHNRARTLPRAIDSVLSQTFAGSLEVVVVDDGSTDETPSTLARYPDLRVVSQPQAGAAAARNAGVAAATGTYVAFIDSDDEWMEGKLTRQLAIVERRPDVALVAGGSSFLDGDGRVVLEGTPTFEGDVLETLLFDNRIVTSSVLVRREALEEVGPPFCPDLVPIEDWHLWVRVAGRHPIVIAPTIEVRYHLDNTGISRMQTAEEYRALFLRMYEALRRDPSVGPVVERRWAELLSNAHVQTAYKLYERGQVAQARRELVIAIRVSRRPIRWPAVASMLVMSPRWRERLKRRLGHTPVPMRVRPR